MSLTNTRLASLRDKLEDKDKAAKETLESDIEKGRGAEDNASEKKLAAK